MMSMDEIMKQENNEAEEILARLGFPENIDADRNYLWDARANSTWCSMVTTFYVYTSHELMTMKSWNISKDPRSRNR